MSQLIEAPMVIVDPLELTDQRLDPKEAVIKEREELLSIRQKKHAYPGSKDLMDAERSTGPRMSYTELIRRLKKIYPPLLVKDGIEGHVALYRRKKGEEMAAEGYDLSVPVWYNEHKYVTGFPKTEIPEWGHLVGDTDGIAEREVRGWRSVLIAFIESGAIPYQAVVEEFGNPSSDTRNDRWMQILEQKR